MKTFLIILFIFVLLWWLSLFAEPVEDCPRVIRGYNCKGQHCDHSHEAVREALIDMGRLHEWL